jgi:putative transposase
MNDSTKEAGMPKGKPELIRIDEGEIRNHLDQIVRGTVEETLNALLEAEADAICRASRYERSPERADTRAGHYDRKLQTRVGEVTLKMPKLRTLPFETAYTAPHSQQATNKTS